MQIKRLNQRSICLKEMRVKPEYYLITLIWPFITM
ncbi:hypothetical protein GGQ60_000107 [Pedobacter zeae]|uniref:Uncharacterized protein n=1 Tax=Pedobacter zeae TaxID=1737356 RepID=A0A7W6P3Q4_9SPHI|nr:hypothetical protein [Pedobacter zeae]